MDGKIPDEQYRRIFEALPGAFLLLLHDPGFMIADASEGYLQATLRERDEILGRPVFDVFPDNPDTPGANSTLNLSRSLKRVIDSGTSDLMAVQRYDVGRADGAGFEQRYWSPVNSPVFSCRRHRFAAHRRIRSGAARTRCHRTCDTIGRDDGLQFGVRAGGREASRLRHARSETMYCRKAGRSPRLVKTVH